MRILAQITRGNIAAGLILTLVSGVYCFVLVQALAQTPTPQASQDATSTLELGASKEPTEQTLKSQKLAIEQRYRTEVEACYQKFVVNACKEEASQKRMNALSEVRKEELKLSAIEREKKAQALKKEQELKELEHANTVSAQIEKAHQEAETRLKINQDKNAEHDAKAQNLNASSQVHTQSSESSKAPLSKPQNDARAQYERKLDEAQKHKEEVQRRLAQKGKLPNQADSDTSSSSTPSTPSTPSSSSKSSVDNRLKGN